MIDWVNLAANALWILGCAVLLATLSYASWEASVLREKMSARLGRSSYQVAINLGFLLFTAGLAATADTLLARIVWCILALLSLFLLIVSAVQAKREPKPPITPPGSHEVD